MSDPRFARLHTDPRFVRPKAAKNKLVLDDRFAGLFDQDKSSSKGTKVDKYGRKRSDGETGNELKRYYRMEDKKEEDGDEESSDEEEGSAVEEQDKAVGADAKPDLMRGEGLIESSDEEEADSDSDSESDDGPVTLGPAATLRRQVSRSPSIDLSETEAVFPDEDEDEDAELAASDDEETQAPTRRIAVVNMDWDHLRAVDLFRVLASPLSLVAPSVGSSQPSKMTKKKTFDEDGEDVMKGTGKLQIIKGRLLKLVVYQSEFGRERIEREEREGPPKELFLRKDDDDDDEGTMRLGRMKTKVSRKKRKGKKNAVSDSEESDEEITEADLVREQVEDGQEDYDGEALRRYQLERLRYYYAIATFDSPSSAEHVHTQINGTEFERTANIFDLQFVPDPTTFDDSPVHDEATEATIAAQGTTYEGLEFVTDALRHSKVQLTWDADDPHRKSKIASLLASATEPKVKGSKGKGKQINDDDVNVYLASSSEDEDDEEAEDAFFEAESSGKAGKRDKLRSLFGLDSSAAQPAWDGGQSSHPTGDMQITFAPALTDDSRASSSKSKAATREEESALETYKRKEKERRERKKAERKARKAGVTLAPEGEEGPEFGGEDIGPGGFDDDFFKDDGGDDAWDGDREFTVDEVAAKKKAAAGGKLSKKQKREAKIQEEREREMGQAELALLVDDDDEGGEDGSRHFDMRKILKSEKGKGKKLRKGKGKQGDEDVVKDDFKIDLKDDRFKSLHEDHEFAIDPSNPKFQKTKSMDALLAEGRKRRSSGRDARAPVGVTPESRAAPTKKVDDSQSLATLMESVKRKSGDVGGRGKRAKMG